MGAALFTILSMKIGGPDESTTRIAANIVSGVGFLGAGAIMRSSQRIVGLITASTIWLTASLSMAIGAGSILFASMVTAITLVILWFFPLIEKKIDSHTDSRSYQINCRLSLEIRTLLERNNTEHKLELHENSCTKSDGLLVLTWFITGKPRNHERFMDFLIKDENILSFQY